MNRKCRLTLLLFAVSALCTALAHAGVADTRHNLSVNGPGSIKATSESEICIFCHTPHNASPAAPLWNRSNPGSIFTPYSSSTATATPGNPTGASILCLSCHDGTIALGELISRTAVTNVVGGPNMPAGPSNLTQDLSDDHPVSFDYSISQSAKPTELVLESSLNGAVKLDDSGQMQCSSCHNAHEDQFGKFLVMPDLNGALCLTCHIKDGWASGSHSNSSALQNGQTVSSHACNSCHVQHSASGSERLLSSQVEENVCFTCHDSSVAATNIQAEFNKFSRHPITVTTGTHDPTETAVAGTRHVECTDCHNSHAAASSGVPSGPLTGVRGVNISGTEVSPLSQEYEVCFRCHADSHNKPAPPTTRQFNQTNVRIEFATSNPSYHPVLGSAADTNTPSLIGLTSGSTINCGDCHNNDNTNGPKGAHGSIFPHILSRQYLTQDNSAESASAYALCYACHSQLSILNDEGFSQHNKHIKSTNTPCNVCHDPHGSQQPRLINFDTSIVLPNDSGRLEFFSSGPGTNSGGCYLDCHGKDHNPCTYNSTDGFCN